MSLRRTVVAVAACVAFTGATGGADAAHRAEPSPLRLGEKGKRCHDLRFSERLRAHGAGCSEARLVARHALRHIEYDPESGQRIDSRVRGRHRAWSCTGAGFNPLPVACRRSGRWIKFQVWAD